MSADSIGNLKDEKNVLLNNQLLAASILITAMLIAENRVADQTEIVKFLHFFDQWRSRNESFVKDAAQLDEYTKQYFSLLPKIPEYQLKNRMK